MLKLKTFSPLSKKACSFSPSLSLTLTVSLDFFFSVVLWMKSNRELATAQVAGLHSARSQEKHEYDIDKQEDYNHGKNDYSLHIQGHGAMQNTVVFQVGGRQIGRCQSLFCQTVHTATMLERRGGSRMVREGVGFGARVWYGGEGGWGQGSLLPPFSGLS